MKTYKFHNATVYVYGEVNKERLRRATINLIKQSYKVKGGLYNTYGNTNTSRDIRKEQILD